MEGVIVSVLLFVGFCYAFGACDNAKMTEADSVDFAGMEIAAGQQLDRSADSVREVIYKMDGNAKKHVHSAENGSSVFDEDYRLSVFDNKELYSLITYSDSLMRRGAFQMGVIRLAMEKVRAGRQRDSLTLLSKGLSFEKVPVFLGDN